ncbi:MAG TPA: hypothetical protein VEY92_08430 [Pseudoxanthomonas sp.]|nr:hypothetical protein [Pseudoxanthomonas sp.]
MHRLNPPNRYPHLAHVGLGIVRVVRNKAAEDSHYRQMLVGAWMFIVGAVLALAYPIAALLWSLFA